MDKDATVTRLCGGKKRINDGPMRSCGMKILEELQEDGEKSRRSNEMKKMVKMRRVKILEQSARWWANKSGSSQEIKKMMKDEKKRCHDLKKMTEYEIRIADLVWQNGGFKKRQHLNQ